VPEEFAAKGSHERLFVRILGVGAEVARREILMQFTRRWFAVLFAAALIVSITYAQEESPAPRGQGGGADSSADAGDARASRIASRALITDEMREGVSKGLRRLAELQDNNGSFTRGGSQNVQIAITALSGLAFLASGSTPETGPYATNIRRAMNYLLGMQDVNTGYITGDGSRIHGHGYATLFLAQL
jgi:hypothetical protein